jgi:hypothetical protein
MGGGRDGPFTRRSEPMWKTLTLGALAIAILTVLALAAAGG